MADDYHNTRCGDRAGVATDAGHRAVLLRVKADAGWLGRQESGGVLGTFAGVRAGRKTDRKTGGDERSRAGVPRGIAARFGFRCEYASGSERTDGSDQPGKDNELCGRGSRGKSFRSVTLR